MKEFPKALYKDGINGDMVTVNDGKEESEARGNGYKPLGEGDFNKDKAQPAVPFGESTAVVDPVKTTLAAENPEEGNIYATSGSAATPHFPFPDKGNEPVEKVVRPVGRPPKKD